MKSALGGRKIAGCPRATAIALHDFGLKIKSTLCPALLISRFCPPSASGGVASANLTALFQHDLISVAIANIPHIQPRTATRKGIGGH